MNAHFHTEYEVFRTVHSRFIPTPEEELCRGHAWLLLVRKREPASWFGKNNGLWPPLLLKRKGELLSGSTMNLNLKWLIAVWLLLTNPTFSTAPSPPGQSAGLYHSSAVEEEGLGTQERKAFVSGSPLEHGHPLGSEERVEGPPEEEEEDRRQAALRLVTTITAMLQGKLRVVPLQGNASCGELLASASLGGASMALFPRELLGLSLVPVLGVSGCPLEAQTLTLQLFELLGLADTEELLMEVKDLIGWSANPLAAATPDPPMGKSPGGAPPGGSGEEDGIGEAVQTCENLGARCAGVSSGASPGRYPCGAEERGAGLCPPPSGSESWIRECREGRAPGAFRRSAPQRNCVDKREERIYSVVEWIPGVSTLYSLGTAVYYALRQLLGDGEGEGHPQRRRPGDRRPSWPSPAGPRAWPGMRWGREWKTGVKAGIKYPPQQHEARGRPHRCAVGEASANWTPCTCRSLDEIYCQGEFPMDVRYYLAPWIESQDWLRAKHDLSVASILFQALQENLDNQHSRFVQDGESFLMQRNIRRFKQNFQRYEEQPWALANIIESCLSKEQDILRSAQLAEQVQMLQVQSSPVETDGHRNIERKMADLRTGVQNMEHGVRSLEEQQDEFDFKYKTQSMEGNITEEERNTQMRVLQYLLNSLDNSRKDLLSRMNVLLDAAEQLFVVLGEELTDWQRRQQKSCIGAPVNTCLNQLESWFTGMAECLFQLCKFLRKIDELQGKVTYERDPFKTEKPALQNRVEHFLTSLLRSAFVVETQPAMPQGKGPMVLRTNVQFSVRTRLLVKVPELNHAMKVKVSMGQVRFYSLCLHPLIMDAVPMKGYRRFNVLGNSSKALNMAESTSGGMVADFRHLSLKEQKSGGGGKGVNDLSLSVMEELHIIHFETVFELHGLSVTLEASSLPVVVISNSSQQQTAWASVLWFNMLCTDPTNVKFFASSPVASWSQLAEGLSWQFLSNTKRGLDDSQLDMIAQKLFDKQRSYSNCRMPWARFSKEMLPNANFTFWTWFDGILVLVKNYLENLWRDGCIMGFVSKVREKTLLKKKQDGTFLLRFSESVKDGGITFSWVESSVDGTPNVRSVQPFTKEDLSQIPFSEIIRNFQILEAENIPENPLKFLYPNTPKDEAFGKYYAEKSGAESPYLKYIKTKLVFISKENTLEAKSPMNTLSVPEATVPMNELCMPHGEEAAASDDPRRPSDARMSEDDWPLLGHDLPLEDLSLVDLSTATGLQEFLTSCDPMMIGSDSPTVEEPSSAGGLPNFATFSDSTCYTLQCSPY
ncbi:hypothetical protein SKAU_G00152460 [Synaphobranchus kaupii]|uniref:SH2 domain-containing protein n=1 Tax=Synaphobranchus kaupii TaxID=118154 RepID=A0A9Q1FH01_SYNKA|nr:hypothetical protein SKAU_G00152460 [Synaphobranchus kaupii]